MKRTVITTVFAAIAAIAVSSCSRDERYLPVNYGQETHAIFNITVAKNTKTRTLTKASVAADSKTSYDTDKTHGYIDSNIAFGLIGLSEESKEIVVDNLAVFERNGARTADLLTSDLSGGPMSVSAFYPYVKEVSYHNDGSYVISFTPDDIEKGVLASDAVVMKCNQDFETVNLKFRHVTNSIGFKICDITEEQELSGLIHIRKVVLHGLAVEGLLICNGDGFDWRPEGKRKGLVFFDGNSLVERGEENALYVGAGSLSADKKECRRMYLVPEVLKEGKHYVEVVYDVDEFEYDGMRYPASKSQKQSVTLAGVIPDDTFELGLQYTFVLGLNLSSVYRTIEFSASVDEWDGKYDSRILNYNNE